LLETVLSHPQAWLIGSAVVLIASIAFMVRLRRVTPEERERRRRLIVNQNRRSVEGLLTEASDQIIHYQYALRGVAYFASQDVRHLRDRLPEDPDRLIGPVTVRYEPRNPANSIVVCEDWSGLPALHLESIKTEVSEENTRCN
jgi:hypothetical protein